MQDVRFNHPLAQVRAYPLNPNPRKRAGQLAAGARRALGGLPHPVDVHVHQLSTRLPLLGAILSALLPPPHPHTHTPTECVQACAADRARLCGGILPGSARVIRCLKDK